ncbi:MAG: hypothetical protein LBS31_01760 [Candidatus Adiutrix sp.]|jgi:MraZ protein|nr:hypothetical protein [Candidatus Adiutrix sp.]
MAEPFSFIGEFAHSLDDKARLALPGKLREELQKSARPDEVTASANKEGYVALYPYEQWLKIEEKLSEIPDTRTRMITTRGLVGKAKRVPVDKLGRLVIPQELREMAGLSREVTVLGGIYKIEIWDRARLQIQMAEEEALVLETLNSMEVPL